jgi:hypothetical protein
MADDLRSRIAGSRAKIAELRASLQAAERELDVWTNALALETGKSDETMPDAPPSLWSSEWRSAAAVTLGDAKDGSSLVFAAIRDAGRPVKSSELIALFSGSGVMTRRTVFWCLKKLKEEGRIESSGKGFVLVDRNRQQTEHYLTM